MTASKILSAAMLAIGLTGSAFGLTITSATVAAASGNSNDPSSAAEVKAALSLGYNLSELYSATYVDRLLLPDYVAEGGQAGYVAAYQTSFTASQTDVSIDDVAAGTISGFNSLFLLALGDDDANPDWKIFNITGWNGTDNIFLDRVFPDGNNPNGYNTETVKIFGGNAPQQPNNGVPDSGSTAVLLGSALLGLAIYSRRKSA